MKRRVTPGTFGPPPAVLDRFMAFTLPRQWQDWESVVFEVSKPPEGKLFWGWERFSDPLRRAMGRLLARVRRQGNRPQS